jgi:predicted adenine nucleotide alpha hydrolase (AANH) superfamily ATPase
VEEINNSVNFGYFAAKIKSLLMELIQGIDEIILIVCFHTLNYKKIGLSTKEQIILVAKSKFLYQKYCSGIYISLLPPRELIYF